MSKRHIAALVAALVVLVGGVTTAVLLTQGGAPPQRTYKTPYGPSAHSPTFGLPPASARLTTPPTTSAGTLEMFDSVNVSALPSGSSAVAGYLSGNWPTWLSLRNAFPRAYRIPVAIRATPVYRSLVGRMVCLDIEPGDATPAEGGPWAKGEIGLGVKPCEYANESTMPEVKASLAHWLGSAWRSKVFLWVAAWTYHRGLLVGYDADQWTDHGPNGQNYDESSVSRAFLGIKPPPKLPVCYSHRITRYQCNLARNQVAKDKRAVSSSNGAYKARGCPTLSQRVSWFGTRLRKYPKVKTQSRRRALSASRRAYNQRSCGVFKHRANYYSSAVSRIIKAN